MYTYTYTYTICTSAHFSGHASKHTYPNMCICIRLKTYNMNPIWNFGHIPFTSHLEEVSQHVSTHVYLNIYICIYVTFTYMTYSNLAVYVYNTYLQFGASIRARVNIFFAHSLSFNLEFFESRKFFCLHLCAIYIDIFKSHLHSQSYSRFRFLNLIFGVE